MRSTLSTAERPWVVWSNTRGADRFAQPEGHNWGGLSGRLAESDAL